MQAYEKLSLVRDGSVLTVLVNRPEARNAIDRSTMAELETLLGQLEEDRSVAAVVLGGAGGIFVAGGDVKDLRAFDGVDGGRELSLRMRGIFERLEALDLASIAAVDGFAFGGGCELALACDLRVTTPSARWGFKQAVFGVTTGWGGGTRLARLVGPSRALKLLLTADEFDGAEAYRLGVVDFLASESSALELAQEIAQRIAGGAPLALRGAKRIVRQALQHDLSSAWDLETEIFAQTWGSDDHAEAVEAFLQRRSAQWKGR